MGVGGTKLDPVRGVPVRTLKTLADAFRGLPTNVLSALQVDTLTQGLEPRAKIQLDGRIRRIAEYQTWSCRYGCKKSSVYPWKSPVDIGCNGFF